MPFDTTPQPTRHDAEIAIVDKMRDRLLTHGWCQGSLTDGDKRCLMGASLAVGADYTPRHAVLTAIRQFTRVQVSTWNDRKYRTFDDVLNLLAKVRQHFEQAP